MFVLVVRMSVSATIGVVIGLGVVWAIVGVYYYRKDRTHRIDLLVQEARQAAHRSVRLGTRIGRLKTAFEKLRTAFQFLQLLGLLFLDTVPWSDPNLLSSIGRGTILDWGIGGELVKLVAFWAVLASYLVHLILFAGYGYLSRRAGREIAYPFMFPIHRVLVETLFIPTLRNFFGLLDCATEGGEEVARDTSVV